MNIWDVQRDDRRAGSSQKRQIDLVASPARHQPRHDLEDRNRRAEGPKFHLCRYAAQSGHSTMGARAESRPKGQSQSRGQGSVRKQAAAFWDGRGRGSRSAGGGTSPRMDRRVGLRPRQIGRFSRKGRRALKGGRQADAGGDLEIGGVRVAPPSVPSATRRPRAVEPPRQRDQVCLPRSRRVDSFMLRLAPDDRAGSVSGRPWAGRQQRLEQSPRKDWRSTSAADGPVPGSGGPHAGSSASPKASAISTCRGRPRRRAAAAAPARSGRGARADRRT